MTDLPEIATELSAQYAITYRRPAERNVPQRIQITVQRRGVNVVAPTRAPRTLSQTAALVRLTGYHSCLPGHGRVAVVPNISQVAKQAGVSTATVSRVVSGSNGRVSLLTRARVLRAVERLGYAPNSAAKNLRTQRSGKILVTVPDISNPFFALILQGIEDAALRAGYAVLIGDTQHDPTREERYAQMLHRKEADGLIFLGHRLPNEAAQSVLARRAGRRRRCERLRVQPASGRPERAHRQRQGRDGGDGSSLSPRPPPRRGASRVRS